MKESLIFGPEISGTGPEMLHTMEKTRSGRENQGPELVTRTGNFWCVARSCANFVASTLILTA